jgi:hypothetical protein
VVVDVALGSDRSKKGRVCCFCNRFLVLRQKQERGKPGGSRVSADVGKLLYR